MPLLDIIQLLVVPYKTRKFAVRFKLDPIIHCNDSWLPDRTETTKGMKRSSALKPSKKPPLAFDYLRDSDRLGPAG